MRRSHICRKPRWGGRDPISAENLDGGGSHICMKPIWGGGSHTFMMWDPKSAVNLDGSGGGGGAGNLDGEDPISARNLDKGVIPYL